MRTDPPSITVGICTRNRPGQVVRPVEAVLSGTHRDVRLIVVDQSDDDATRRALEPFLSDSRVRYVRSPEIGVANARNTVIALVDTDLLLFTDDDCEPEPGWVAGMIAHAAGHEGAFAIFGPLLPAPGIDTNGVVPSFRPSAPRVIRRGRRRFLGGVTANVLFSREALAAVGQFNSQLGRGGPLEGGEDYEYVLRLMSAGGTVAIVTHPAVLHYRVVPPESVRAWLKADLRAAGTLLAWQTRDHNTVALAQLLHLFWAEFGNALRRTLTWARPFGFARAAWLLHGFGDGLVGARRGRPRRLTVADPLKEAQGTGD